MKKIYNPYLKKSVSKDYIDFIKGKISLSVQDMIDVLSEWEQDFSDCSLLDIGCGVGNISNDESIKRFKNYVGVEPSKEIFEYANKHNKNSNTEFYNCSVEDLPFEDESCDFLISTEVWYYIKDVDRAVKECSRVLKNNSNFLIYTRNPDEMLNWLQIKNVINESKNYLEVYSVITRPAIGNLVRESCNLGEHFFSKLSLEDLTNSFVNTNLKIRGVEKYQHGRIMIQGEKIG